MIKTKDLSKIFGELKAVDSVNLEIKEGELFALLGPNGAGKTTLINMLSTMTSPTGGMAELNGFPISNKHAVRKSIGIVFQDPSLDDELTGRENLDFHGRLYSMPRQLREKRIAEMLKLVGLEDKADLRTRVYSGGMKRRLEIARGLIHHPKILFLDEPTLGLDPQTRRGIWDYIEKLNRDEKVTILLTTHYMEEADYLCKRIAIIDHGKIIAMGSPEKLKGMMGGDIVTIETNEAGRLGKLVEKKAKKERVNGERVVLTVPNGEKFIPEVMEIARKNKIKISSVNVKKPSLEDVFIHFTGRTIREEEASGRDILRKQVRGEWRR